MRVIAGDARRIILETPIGQHTRPTADRIKETLFNMINNDLPDAIFIDLYSGSGGIGIEALSRGAIKCYFVEKDKQAISCIQSNLEATRLEEKATVLAKDSIDALKTIELKNIVADIIFMDPPYNVQQEKRVLEYICNTELIDEYTLIIIEASVETTFDYLEEIGYKIIKNKVYGNSKHVFVQLS